MILADGKISAAQIAAGPISVAAGHISVAQIAAGKISMPQIFKDASLQRDFLDGIKWMSNDDERKAFINQFISHAKSMQMPSASYESHLGDAIDAEALRKVFTEEGLSKSKNAPEQKAYTLSSLMNSFQDARDMVDELMLFIEANMDNASIQSRMDEWALGKKQIENALHEANENICEECGLKISGAHKKGCSLKDAKSEW